MEDFRTTHVDYNMLVPKTAFNIWSRQFVATLAEVTLNGG